MFFVPRSSKRKTPVSLRFRFRFLRLYTLLCLSIFNFQFSIFNFFDVLVEDHRLHFRLGFRHFGFAYGKLCPRGTHKLGILRVDALAEGVILVLLIIAELAETGSLLFAELLKISTLRRY